MLKLNLRAGEKVIVNGAVLEAENRSTLLVHNRAAILRGRDVMTESQADTPARRLYYAAMLAYIEPDQRSRHQDSILTLLSQLMEALEAPQAHAMCVTFARQIATEAYYPALMTCRDIIEYEDEAFSRLLRTAARG